MLVLLELKKSTLSTWMMLFFTATVFLTGFYSDFFQAPSELSPDLNQYRSLFKPGQILGIRELILKNNLGTFHFEKSATDPDTPWTLISPRKLPANSSLVKNILKDLNQVKIRSVHQMDAINVSNYSLDNTSLEVTLVGSNDKDTTLKFGLVNPIDNSTYVSLSDQKAIYHIDNISTSLNTLDLGNFVDTRIFTFDPAQITEFKIYRNRNESKKLVFFAALEKEGWVGQQKKTLKTEAVKEYFSLLADLHSNFILDKVNEKLQLDISEYLKKPSFTISVLDRKGSKYNYTLSGLVRSLSGLKIEKWQNFIIQPSNREFPYILGKKNLSLFNRSERRMKGFPVKKLFY
jgi:hypothetical protein